MIIAIWQRWRGGGWKWLLLLAAVVALDAIVGTALLAWEIETFKEAW